MNFTNFVEDTLVLNQNYRDSWFNIIVCVVTGSIILLMNMLVLVSVKVKDKALIDKMVVMDCVANIMLVGVLLCAFPCRVWKNTFLCAGITFFRVFTVTINK